MQGLRLTDCVMELGGADRGFRLEIATLDLPPGKALALTGASGSGKTLLLELLGLLRAPGTGTAYSADQLDLAALWQHGPRHAALAQTRGRVFGFVPQSGGLMPFLTVGENIELTQKVAGRTSSGVADLMDRLDIAGIARQYPAALSIGQRQRVAIARALAHRPPYIIADEPTAALDPDLADRVLALLLEVAADQGAGVLLSSHDLARMDRFGIPRRVLRAQEVAPGRVLSRLDGGAPC